MKNSIADILFIFGMSLSRSEQMTEVAWERRWSSHEQRYVGTRQFQIDIDDAKRLAVFLLQQSKDRLDIAAIIPEFHAVVEQLFPDDPILHALMDQTAYKGMTVPVIIANTISSYPNFGWMHLFANNAVLRGEITTLMRFFQLIKGDIYAGFRIPGVSTAVKNLAYLCVKLQAEIGGDEQILKYNGIGGLQNSTPIPLKTYINSLVEKFKGSISTIITDIPDASTIARYDSRYQRTRNMLNDIFAKYLHPQPAEEEDQDIPHAATGFQPFDDSTSTSSDDSDDDDQPPKRGLKRIRGKTESITSDSDRRRSEATRVPSKRRRLTKPKSKSPPQESSGTRDEVILTEPVAGPSHHEDEISSKVLTTISESDLLDPTAAQVPSPSTTDPEIIQGFIPATTQKAAKVRRMKK
jgi:hypothetical protein